MNDLFQHNQSKNLDSAYDIYLLSGNEADGVNEMQSLKERSGPLAPRSMSSHAFIADEHSQLIPQ